MSFLLKFSLLSSFFLYGVYAQNSFETQESTIKILLEKNFTSSDKKKVFALYLHLLEETSHLHGCRFALPNMGYNAFQNEEENHYFIPMVECHNEKNSIKVSGKYSQMSMTWTIYDSSSQKIIKKFQGNITEFSERYYRNSVIEIREM